MSTQVLYVEKEDGSYGPLQTGSFLVGNYLDDYFQKRGRFERQCLERLLSGEYSPVAYYQVLRGEVDAELSSNLVVFGGAGRRTFTDAGRSRTEVDGGAAGDAPPVS